MDYLYRYKETRWSESKLMLIQFKFPIISRTKCGAWVDDMGRKRFVNLNARKRYACPTEAEALESYHARKRRQIRILKARLAEAETALTLAHDGDTSFTLLDLKDGH